MHPNMLQGILWFAGLQDEFYLIDCKRFKDQRRMILTLGRKREGGCCSKCGRWSEEIHSRDGVQLRDLSVFEYQMEWIFERFTIHCSSCNQFVVEDHWLWRSRRAFTWRFECHVSQMCEEMTNAAVGRLEKLNDKTVYRIDHELLELRLERQTLPELGPHYSMDEVYFRYFPEWSPDKPKSFVTNLLDLTHSKVIANSPGRDEKSASNCLQWLSKTQQRQAQSFATDLHPPYHKAIRYHCPSADIVLDRFHIMQLFNEAMNEFRKSQLELAQDSDEIQLLKGQSKWLLLTRPEKLSKKSKVHLEELKQLNERVIDALLIREHFVQFFQSPTLRIAKVRWYQLLKLVDEIDIVAFNEFFRKLKAWSKELWNYFLHKTSSAVIEAINHRIKTVKSAAYGYRNLRYFQLKILQRVGFLNTKFAPLPNRQPKTA